MTQTSPLRIAIAGAGAVGCFTGGLFAAGGHHVTLLGRQSVLSVIKEQGLRVSDYTGLDVPVPKENLTLSEDADALSRQDLVIVAVKSLATEDMAHLIRDQAARATRVVSFQNGMSNTSKLRAILAQHDVRAAMVPFNVVMNGPGWFHRASSGDVVIGTGADNASPDLASLLSQPALPITESAMIENVQWGKLLINLNNALNALSGLPLKEQLGDRAWRRVMAAQMAEALRVFRAKGIQPVSPAPVPAGLLPFILRLPTPIFTRIASAMLSIDPHARLSMAQDLDAGRLTEIDELQGHILRMANSCDVQTPVNAAVFDAIRRAEKHGLGADRPSPESLYQQN